MLLVGFQLATNRLFFALNINEKRDKSGHQFGFGFNVKSA